ncbi:MAG: ankyrin repeat domain-containing protein [Opitutales bacterium]|nr:ankyrin repeat domain-containing protein [Opitutales bacterium]
MKTSSIFKVIYWIIGPIVCLLGLAYIYIASQKPVFEQKLWAAIKEDDVEKIRFYEKLGADWTAEVAGYQNYRIMDWITECGASKSYEYFKKRGLDHDKTGRNGLKPVFHATKLKQETFAIHLLKNGAKQTFNYRGTDPYTQMDYDFGEIHLLHFAAENGAAKVCRWLVEQGIDVDLENEMKMTPLAYAGLLGNNEAAEVLIEHEADVNHYSTPLKFAIYRKDPELTKILLEAGANPNSVEDGFHAICSWPDTKSSNFYTIFPDYGDMKPWMAHPLTMAAYYQQTEIVGQLIQHGVSLNFQTAEKKNSALHLAAYKDNLEMVKILLEAGVDTELMNTRNLTAKSIALSRRNKKIADLIEQHRM